MADQKSIKLEFEITNQLGLHGRPASLFVQTAANFKSDIFVEKDGAEVDGKSIMNLLMLAAGIGTKIRISAIGEDCEEAIMAIANLFKQKFNEE
ncbi:MAG: HPr family phosphocarrier protein [Victivallaceae bacterium]|jgi:phosphocarrier protein|nr:HPr family phosphocarrier protein [Victivallaceae bacterium]MDD3703635.1 HPr family phosphocarrier protein [Victivallaceae bacterium]MDD4317070.1 HPr family phosphocarrier protein [Victivallaceae bacterium]MDD5663302.1 HPr family phosphocarrier protein [Victivallaceae bacterium]NLK84088.1 HPr family phosphocarrier protein [Lentisphaerota bacterium]